MSKNYIGQKGYTIYKDEISNDISKFIESELSVKPFVPKAMTMQKAQTFTIYRESSTRYYLPKFFGLENFNSVDSKIPKGKNINLSFNGKLRDYQISIVSKYMDYVKSKYENFGGGCLEIDTGMGKTVMAIDIISKMRLKTIILVHKEFLMNQWIERIAEFMPQAKVGKLQGKIVDIEGNDIVIAMIQSLSMKEYDVSIFKDFGFMIIDEVHHMGAEVFSNSLSKVVTPYTLGLSATMNRKDGLSKVFKMFLGETIHVEKRDTSDQSVLVKSLQYKVDDDEFNDIKYDFRGNTQISTMITKLCKYNNRSEFILSYIVHTLSENSEQQIMILAHNKSLLKYLYEAIEHRKIANGSVGYYVGGMKEKDLKISETKQIVIATYSMASEGLDIKTLTTLVLATPKTDIVQAVGRILRVKHEQPVVIDIVDAHEVFQRQYQKRKTFYRKQKYKIIETNNDNKTFDKTLWNVTYDPNKKKTKNSKNEILHDDEDEKIGDNKCLIEL